MLEEGPQSTAWPWRPVVTEEARRELDSYSARYGPLLDEARWDFEELVETGVMSRARELSERRGDHFNHNELPLFFVGDLDAPLVLVHLNPKHANNPAPKAERPLPVESFEAYFDGCRHFGARMYGLDSSREQRSPFDHKQIVFLKPFGVIDFDDESGREDRFTNLERAIDDKLQLELILRLELLFWARLDPPSSCDRTRSGSRARSPRGPATT